ncbi:hypothetical protein [Nevskia sp.]|uniref:hypothetical protein n=1 Tax=Nevskia sp. TaxID=1929292 RepID=UPI0025FD792E|nr:hypothetical protein [Nevskia sp.]
MKVTGIARGILLFLFATLMTFASNAYELEPTIPDEPGDPGNPGFPSEPPAAPAPPPSPPPSTVAAWSLSKQQRQAYLQYYAPLIFKRSDGNGGKHGRDWITNFDFDQDGNFSNNRTNWLQINQYVDASRIGPSSYDRWRIRPTLYTALIEYMEGSTKNLVMLFHVYHGADKDGSDIHDWERVEIVLRGATGSPGSGGEFVSSATLTVHGQHIIRAAPSPDLNFMATATGKHLMLWQSDESDPDTVISAGPHAHELRFVQHTYAYVTGRMTANAGAEVEVIDDDAKNVHFLFVPEASTAAVNSLGARQLSYASAASLTSYNDNANRAPWSSVPRITYELQDLADILPTHWQGGSWTLNWLANEYADILLESPIINENGQIEVSTGLQRFYSTSRDASRSNQTDGRDGYPTKNWLYGSYAAETNEDWPSEGDDFPGFAGSGIDSYGRTRGAASGYYNSHNTFWWQHDYFVHSGPLDTSLAREAGVWLAGPWYTQANGGFDGRWVQLFDDRPGYEPIAPLSLTITYPGNLCTDTFRVTATARGGVGPISLTWVGGVSQSTTATTSSVTLYSYQSATVTARSADGQTSSSHVYVEPHCGSGEQIP